MNPFALLQAVSLSQKIDAIVESAHHALLTQWRRDAPGKTDEEVLRAKLADSGWKYSRQKGRWHHPESKEAPAPRSLNDLARLIARATLQNALKKQEKKPE